MTSSIPTKQRVAVVTGAGSGMGRLAAQRLAADGCVVAALDLQPDGLAATADLAPNIHTFECDVTDADAIAAVIAEVVEQYGPIDRLVAAAGIAPTENLADQSLDTILTVMDVNYGGVVRAVKAVLPSMIERNQGEIAVFSSMSGWMPVSPLGAYSASKHALVAFCEVLDHELADSAVRILCICPPLVNTPMIGQLERGGVTAHKRVKPIAPAAVIEAMERAFTGKKLFVFPGFGTPTMIRARRFTPKLLWWFLDRSGM